MQSTTRSAIFLFAALYILALLSGSPSALRPVQKSFKKIFPPCRSPSSQFDVPIER